MEHDRSDVTVLDNALEWNAGRLSILRCCGTSAVKSLSIIRWSLWQTVGCWHAMKVSERLKAFFHYRIYSREATVFLREKIRTNNLAFSTDMAVFATEDDSYF